MLRKMRGYDTDYAKEAGWMTRGSPGAGYDLLSTDRFRLDLATLGPVGLISGEGEPLARGTSDRRFLIPRRDSKGYSHFKCLRAHWLGKKTRKSVKCRNR
jgi:hypothetical protein